MDTIRLCKAARRNEQDRKRNPERYLLGVIMDTFLLAILTVFLVMIFCDRPHRK